MNTKKCLIQNNKERYGICIQAASVALEELCVLISTDLRESSCTRTFKFVVHNKTKRPTIRIDNLVWTVGLKPKPCFTNKCKTEMKKRC